MSKRTIALHFDPAKLDAHQGDTRRMLGFLISQNMEVYDEVEIALINSKEVQAMYTNSGNKGRRLVTMRYENRQWTSVK
jgi:hypothetical protein